MTTSAYNQYDTLERLIFETGIRIAALDFHPEMDLMVVVLHSKIALEFRLFAFKLLNGADPGHLNHYELVADGLGVHWPQINEDLSLKGFLEEELKRAIGHGPDALAA